MTNSDIGAVLGILAAFSAMLAWMREDQTFIAVFAAQATFAFSRPSGRRR
jgi:hypothetical protein